MLLVNLKKRFLKKKNKYKKVKEFLLIQILLLINNHKFNRSSLLDNIFIWLNQLRKLKRKIDKFNKIKYEIKMVNIMNKKQINLFSNQNFLQMRIY